MTDMTRYVENSLNQFKLNYPEILEKWINANTYITHKDSGGQEYDFEAALL